MPPLRPERNIIIVGAGPFISRSLSLYLASQTWTIVLVSRSEEKLQNYAAEIKKTYPESPAIITIVADASDSSSLISALDRAAEKLGGKVDVLFYNAAVVGPSDLLDLSEEAVTRDFKISVVGTLLAGQWFVKHANRNRMATGEYPLFLVTGGLLDKNPNPDYASLSAAKSASQNIVAQFGTVFPGKYNILVGQPLVDEPIVPLDNGGWATKSEPGVIVDKIFKPFFIKRENIGDGERKFDDWVRDLVW